MLESPNPGPKYTPSVDDLRYALNYPPQLINRISLTGYKWAPEMWPKPPLDETSFYLALLKSCSHPVHHARLLTGLYRHLSRKGRKPVSGRHRPIEPLTQLCAELIRHLRARASGAGGEIDVDALRDARSAYETLMDGLGDAVDLDMPRLRAVGDWLLRVYERSRECLISAAAPLELEEEGAHTATAAGEQHDPLNVLLEVFADVIEAPYERARIEAAQAALGEHLERIEQLAQHRARYVDVLERLTAFRAAAAATGELPSLIDAAMQRLSRERDAGSPFDDWMDQVRDGLRDAINTVNNAQDAFLQADNTARRAYPSPQDSTPPDWGRIGTLVAQASVCEAALTQARDGLEAHLRRYLEAALDGDVQFSRGSDQGFTEREDEPIPLGGENPSPAENVAAVVPSAPEEPPPLDETALSSMTEAQTAPATTTPSPPETQVQASCQEDLAVEARVSPAQPQRDEGGEPTTHARGPGDGDAGVAGLAREAQPIVEGQDLVEAEESIEDAADAAPASDEVSAVRGHLLAMVAAGRPALAYHLARSVETRLGRPLDGLGANGLLALALSPELTSFSDAVTEPLREAFSHILSIEPESRGDALMMLAAALRPALLAPYLTSARAVLDNVLKGKRVDNQALRDVAAAVINAGRLSAAFSEATFKGAQIETEHARALAQLQAQAGRFLHEAQHKNIKYAAATKVWRNWVDIGPIAEMVRAVQADDRTMLEPAGIFLEEWGDRHALNRLIDATDQEIRKRQARLRPIDGAAREDLVQMALDACRYVESWRQLNEGADNVEQAGERASMGTWVSRTTTLIDKAIAELHEQEIPDPDERAGLIATMAALRDLRLLIDTEVPAPARLTWYVSLGRELALLPDFPLDASWMPVDGYGTPALEEALIAAAAVLPSREAAWRQAMQRCLHQSSAHLLEIERFDGDPERLVELEREQRDGLEHCRRVFAARRQDTERAIAHALDFGWLDETSRSELVDRLECLENRFGADYGRAFNALDGIGEELQQHQRNRVDEERERLRGHPALAGNAALRERITNLLNAGDIVTAADYLTHAESGTEPPADDRLPRFQDAFFPGFVQAAEQMCGERATVDILSALADGHWPGGLAPAPAQPTTDAYPLIHAFLSVSRYAEQGHPDDLPSIAACFTAVGFDEAEAVAITPDAGASAGRNVQLTARRVCDRDTCIIPELGSQANGRYRVLCVPASVPVLGLFRAASDSAHMLPGVPTLLLYAGRVGVADRRELARESRKKDAQVLLIDEWLALYLSALPQGVRLKAMFECTLPWFTGNPYASTAEVPDEMFMGRRLAIRSIVDLNGTNLVYGGRQLGKTALLRETVRRYHNPTAGFQVLWVDLEAAEIGKGRPLADLWTVLSANLPPVIIGDQQVQRYETLHKRIIAWLESDPTRRLLLLLDEADILLAQDAADGYRILRGLKSLMERSERRCKVVLAGLHNVARASRDPNTPMAHLAAPLCIGPLIEGGEAREAFRLVTMPLRALGFRIDDDVVNRILAYANYSANLIQDFVKRLLIWLNDPDGGRFDPHCSPPYQITSDHVEKAYQLKDLRGFIRDRFQITLNLDPRYKLIALIIAKETLSRRQDASPDGSSFDVGWIREQALRWWERGFDDVTLDAFRVLLDEMVGLGILRASEGRYALRSPNLVNLLGSHATITQDLEDAAAADPPAPYTAAIHRRQAGAWRASPLTAEQEYLLTNPGVGSGVSLVFGLDIAGINQVAQALAEAAAQLPGVTVVRADGADLSALFADRGQGTLGHALDRQLPDTHLLCLVGHDNGWSPEHVRQATSALQSRRRRNRSARVVFIGGAAQALTWMDARAQIGRALPDVVSLKPWAPATLQRWLRDLGTIDDDREVILKEATGYWHTPLHHLFASLAGATDRWRETIDALGEQAPDPMLLDADLLAQEWAADLLRDTAQWAGQITAAELSDLATIDLDVVERFLGWGDTVGFVRAQKDGAWLLDPYVQRGVLAL